MGFVRLDARSRRQLATRLPVIVNRKDWRTFDWEDRVLGTTEYPNVFVNAHLIHRLWEEENLGSAFKELILYHISKLLENRA